MELGGPKILERSTQEVGIVLFFFLFNTYTVKNFEQLLLLSLV